MIHAGEKRTLLKHARIKQNGLDAQSTFPSGHNPINWKGPEAGYMTLIDKVD
jgi:hypothetical protein